MSTEVPTAASSVKIMFPAVHKGVKSSKDHPDSSPYNYITVKNGHAIVVTALSVIALNLRDYFLNYQTIQEEEHEAFNKLMDWMEGKSFTTEFWSYLTKKNNFSVIDADSILVSGDCFEKQLIYREQDVMIDHAIAMLKNNWVDGKSQVPGAAISSSILKLINDTIGKLAANSAIIFEFNNQLSSTIRFTVEDMDFIFGIVLASNECLQKPYNFQGMKAFVD